MSCFTPEKAFSRECFETVIEAIAEGVIIIDTEGIIRYCNRAMERLSGVPVEGIVGSRCGDILVCACRSMEECAVLNTGTVDSMECRVRRADGGTVPVLKNGRVMRDAEGAVIGAVETLTDITVLRNTESRLEQLESRLGNTHRFHNMIGKSHAMRQVFELIELAAGATATVLIEGETGTGKELAAEAIHRLSDRRDGPLVKVNCSALPESLLESELFGHARGAFTGAIQDKIGRFERADGGTLFLDEIGEISPLIQVKLLRFLQEHEFERVGESETRKADVRIIAATNRTLRDMVQAGSFRDDLYYRLKVFPIRLPPLRVRREDIGLLVDHFIARFNADTGKNITGLTHDAAVTLMDYCWPGNIRELENAIEHAFVTCQDSLIDLFDLPMEIRKVELRAGVCAPEEQAAGSQSGLYGEQLRRGTEAAGDLDREHLVDLLNRYRWNRTRVAEHLGVDRTTVWRKMKKLGIRNNI